MKKTLAFITISALVLSLCACSDINKSEFPYNSMMEYSAVFHDENGTYLISGVYNDAVMSWIRSCPFEKEVNEDISQWWNYKLVFCDCKLDEIIYGEQDFYIPSTARIYTVYINESENIVQFGDVAYLVSGKVNETQCYDGIQLCIDGTMKLAESREFEEYCIIK